MEKGTDPFSRPSGAVFPGGRSPYRSELSIEIPAITSNAEKLCNLRAHCLQSDADDDVMKRNSEMMHLYK